MKSPWLINEAIRAFAVKGGFTFLHDYDVEVLDHAFVHFNSLISFYGEQFQPHLRLLLPSLIFAEVAVCKLFEYYTVC